MIGQFDLYGIFLPSFAILIVSAYVVLRILIFTLGALGFYRLVWHRSLFNLALYVTALGGLSIAIHWFQR